MTLNWLVKTRRLTFLLAASLLVACGGGGGEGEPRASSPGGGSGTTIARSTVSQVATPLDDVEERADGSMYTTSSDLELINDGTDQTVGMRFVVSVPANARITNAYIQFTVDEVTTSATNLKITGEARAEAPAFSSVNGDVSSRSATTAFVNWAPSAWTTIGDALPAQRTPNLASIVQEVVDLSGWDLNNHLVIMVTGTGGRTAVSRDNSTTQAPALYIDYEIIKNPGGGSEVPGSSNNAPIISGNPASNVAQDSAYTFTPVASDSDAGDTLTFSISNTPSWATFSTVTGTLSGTPTAVDAGTTSNIVISVTDGLVSASLPSFSVTVTSDTPPVAADDSAITSEDNSISISVLSNDTDVDGDTLSITSVTQPSNGDVSISGSNVSYTPNANYFGNETFTYTIDDGFGGTDTATVTVTVNPVNDTPVAMPDSASTTQGTTVIISLLDNDTGLGDGSIVVAITSSTASGTLVNNNDGTVSYTSSASFTGTDNFIYQIMDADGQVSTANGSIIVTCPGGCTGGTRTVQLTWDASPSADVIGYYVYYGITPGNYTGAIWVPSGTSYDYVTNLLGMQYFSITAQTSDGNESDFSVEVSVNI